MMHVQSLEPEVISKPKRLVEIATPFTEEKPVLSWVPVKSPDHTPTRDRLVITLAIGEAGRRMHELTRHSQSQYASRVGADYVVLTKKTQVDRLPCFEKFRYRDYVPLYSGGTLCIDADAYIFGDTPDVFEIVPEDHIGLRDIRPAMPQPDFDWYNQHSMANLCRSQNVSVHPSTQSVYWNSGVWVGRPEHADYWTPPRLPVPGDWCDEEGWCRRNVFTKNMKVHELGWAWNWTWCEDRDFSGWVDQRPYVAHLAGMGSQVPGWDQPNRVWREAMLRVLRATDTTMPSVKTQPQPVDSVKKRKGCGCGSRK